ncbi:MAG: sigma-70 family RNA polymerase sigma factor [Acidobacteriota bacterium]|nr:sigma-70 family RNA polymerase sigma factor [Acidobacteriota bacterium]
MESLAQELYRKSGAGTYGLGSGEFAAILAEIADRYLPAGSSESEIENLYRGLHVEEIALARACAAGSERAWEEFMSRYREKLRAAALAITRDDSRARELADSLYADLFGTPTRDGRRISKLAHYCGRGSLAGWLRTVLAQSYVNNYRDARHTVSLDSEGEGREPGHAPEADAAPAIDARLDAATDEALASISAEDRYLLACYFLDERTLAEIGKILRVHESTISRRLGKLTESLRECILAGLRSRGMTDRQAQEALEVDVRDIAVDIRRRLTQDSAAGAFSSEKPLPAEKVET